MKQPKKNSGPAYLRINKMHVLREFLSLVLVLFILFLSLIYLLIRFTYRPHWPRGYGMDVGWNNTACVWGALDRDSSTLYLYHEYKRSHAEPSLHSVAIQAVGSWIPGFIDPASRGRGQKDGSQLLNDYQNLGLKLDLAENGVESGLYSVWNRMSTGRLKVFRSMGSWLMEFRLYRRDDKGRVVKENDHLMDAMRYLESRIEGMKVNMPPPHRPRNWCTPRTWARVG